MLLLDGWGHSWRSLAIPVELHARATYEPTDLPKGPGQRWRYIAAGDHEQPWIVLDDDLSVAGLYIERTLAAHDFSCCDALSWQGARLLDGRYLDKPGAEDEPLAMLGGGTSFIAWGGLLRGIEDYPFAPDYLREHDEALVSYHLWRQGAAMIRPRGAFLFQSQAAAFDSRSMHLRVGSKRRIELQRKLAEYGWTAYKDP